LRWLKQKEEKSPSQGLPQSLGLNPKHWIMLQTTQELFLQLKGSPVLEIALRRSPRLCLMEARIIRNNSEQNMNEFVLTGSTGNSVKAMTSNNVIMMVLEALMPKVGHLC
jgi:hypothetical protein